MPHPNEPVLVEYIGSGTRLPNREYNAYWFPLAVTLGEAYIDAIQNQVVRQMQGDSDA